MKKSRLLGLSSPQGAGVVLSLVLAVQTKRLLRLGGLLKLPFLQHDGTDPAEGRPRSLAHER